MGTLAFASIFLEQHRKEGRFLLDGSRQTRFFLLFILTVLLSIPFAYWRQLAVDGLIEILKIACFYFMVVQSVISRGRLRGFILTFAGFVLFIAGTSLRAYLAGQYMEAQGIERTVGVTSAGGDANALGATLASALPIFLLLSFDRSIRWWRPLAASGAVLLLVTQVLTGSRGALLGLLAALGWLWWTSRLRLALLFVGLPVLVAGYFALPDQYKQRYASITHNEMDESSQGRIRAWTAGLHMVVDRPLFGVGIHCFGIAHATGFSAGRKSWLEAHNLYIQVLAELGLVGAVAFFAFLYGMLRLNRDTARQLRAMRPDWHFELNILNALFAGYAVLLISGIFGHSLLRVTWYLYGGIGLVILRLHLDHKPPA
jgi:probable O-glycosylation ligase (exosortase A-associated)